MTAAAKEKTTENALIVIEKADALTVFTTDNALDPYIAKIKAEIDTFVPNVSTKKGRDEIASMAFKVAKCKTYLESVGKELAAEQKKIPAKIDEARRKVWDQLEAMQAEVRNPLTEWEAVEDARVLKHKTAIAKLNNWAVEHSDGCAAELMAHIELLQQVELGPKWDEFAEEAAIAKDKALSSLRATLVIREKHEAEQAELAQLRAEAAIRAQKDHEEKIAREAAERATREAEAKAQKERDDAADAAQREREAAERVALEQKLAIERAEREKAEAILSAELAKKDAERQAQEAVEAEQRRVAEAQAREAAEAKAREKDKAHKTAINRAALDAFKAGGMTDECAKLAVTLIAKRSIPNVSIAY